VLVKMEVSGICGTDKHTYQGYITQYAGTGTPKQIPFLNIQGHENVGTVAAIGSGEEYKDFEGVPLKLGDRVVVGPNVSCGTCYFCRHDFPYYFCENTTDYGNNLSARNPPHLFGGWSQYLYVLPGSFLVRVPDDLPSKIAVLTEVMAVTVGLDRAKQISAFTIVAVDLSDYRLDFAKRLGADQGINAATTTQPERLAFVRSLTHGRGADVVIECAGVPRAVPEGLDLLRLGGLLVEAGNFSDLGEIAINPHRHLCAKSARILGVGGEEPGAYGPSMRQMARYMRYYPLCEFVTHHFALRDVEAAVKKSIAPDSMKVVIEPGA
jgi:threonine dehydrogenase-like Zn-dependent dehydrogenase